MRPARSILITGASSGIGRAVAVEYAAPGVRLVLVGRDTARLEQAAERCRDKGAEVETALVDVRDRQAMHDFIRAADAKAPLDLVLANAGINTGLPAGALAEDPEAVRGILSINLIGALNTVEPIIEPMCARGRGVIADLLRGHRGPPRRRLDPRGWAGAGAAPANGRPGTTAALIAGRAPTSAHPGSARDV